MTTTTTFTLESIFIGICAKLQITPANHSEAEKRYQSIVDYLEEDPFFAGRCLDSYPQGSLRHGTTIKPKNGNEYDLDFVFPLDIQRHEIEHPSFLLKKVEQRLAQRGIYNIDTSKNTAVRVIYAEEFHIDIVPAIPISPAGQILVPHRQRDTFFPSNPEGLATWFDNLAVSRTLKALDATAVKAQAIPLPEPESILQKPPLKKVVQLLKRNRDLYFSDKSERVRPASILITALCGYNYLYEPFVEIALRNIVETVLSRLPEYQDKGVPNPVDPNENLARAWKEHQNAYDDCFSWLVQLSHRLDELEKASNLQIRLGILKVLFGESPVNDTYDQLVYEVRDAGSQQQLAVSSNGHLASKAFGSGPVILARNEIKVPEHNFYGQ